jgi:hypothetical protein
MEKLNIGGTVDQSYPIQKNFITRSGGVSDSIHQLCSRTEVPANSRREVLMGYQYALHQHKKKLREEEDDVRRSQENNSVTSGAYWDEYSEASDSSRERHRDPKHNRRTTARAREENRTRIISAHPLDDEEDFVQETPEAALVAAQAYLLTTQPELGDPRK